MMVQETPSPKATKSRKERRAIYNNPIYRSIVKNLPSLERRRKDSTLGEDDFQIPIYDTRSLVNGESKVLVIDDLEANLSYDSALLSNTHLYTSFTNAKTKSYSVDIYAHAIDGYKISSKLAALEGTLASLNRLSERNSPSNTEHSYFLEEKATIPNFQSYLFDYASDLSQEQMGSFAVDYQNELPSFSANSNLDGGYFYCNEYGIVSEASPQCLNDAPHYFIIGDHRYSGNLSDIEGIIALKAIAEREASFLSKAFYGFLEKHKALISKLSIRLSASNAMHNNFIAVIFKSHISKSNDDEDSRFSAFFLSGTSFSNHLIVKYEIRKGKNVLYKSYRNCIKISNKCAKHRGSDAIRGDA